MGVEIDESLGEGGEGSEFGFIERGVCGCITDFQQGLGIGGFRGEEVALFADKFEQNDELLGGEWGTDYVAVSPFYAGLVSRSTFFHDALAELASGLDELRIIEKDESLEGCIGDGAVGRTDLAGPRIE